VAAGRAPDRVVLLEQYPDLAADLEEFFAGQDELDRWTVPLRQVARQAGKIDPRLLDGDVPRTASLGDYELLEEIGQGGMGVVYRARQKSLQRLVALKMLRRDQLRSAAEVQRFRNEAETVACLDHPHIVPIHEVGAHHDCPYFSMKLVEGGSLAGQLTRFTAEPREAAGLVATVARAVHHAHQRGVLHRDLKPTNILLDGAGQPHVVDFGLARRVEADSSLTQSGAIVGTPSYMAPEQATGKKAAVTTATDVHGLGAILYALLTGRPPFQADNVLETLVQVREREPEPPSSVNRRVDRDLATICLKCLAKEPGRRYGSALVVAEDLERFLACQPIQARRVGLWERGLKWARRRPLAVAALAGLVMALVLLGAGAGWVLSERAGRQRDAETKVSEALVAAAPGLRQGNPHDPGLIAAVQRAEAQLDSGVVGRELRGRVEQLLRDVEMLKRLEKALLQRVIGGKRDVYDLASTEQLYAEAFQWYGVEMNAASPQEAAERIRTSEIATHLVAALDDWVFARSQMQRRDGAALSAVANLADDDPWRRRLREADRRGDRVALEQLARGEETASQSPGSRLLLASALTKGNDAEFVRLLQRAQAAHPADFRINHVLATALFRKKPPDWALTEQFSRVALALRPQSAVVYINLGGALYEQKKLAEAKDAYRKAIALQPDLALAHSNLGLVLGAQKKLPEAEAACRKGVALQPELAAVHDILGGILRDRGKLEAAVAAHRKAIALEPSNAVAHNYLGKALFDQKKLAEALAAFRKAIELEPDHAEAHNGLGATLRSLGKPVEAELILRKAIALEYDRAGLARAHSNLGTVLHDLGKRAEAMAAFRKAIKLDPDLAEAHSWLGVALGGQNKLAEAEAASRKAVELGPRSAVCHRNLGAILGRRGKLSEAEAAFRTAIELDPEHVGAHCNLGAALAAQRKWAKAEEACRKAIQLKPEHAEAHFRLGIALLEQGHHVAAVEAFGRSAGLDPGQHTTYYNLALSLRILRRYTEAEAAVRRAIKLQPNYWQAWGELGRSLGARGDAAAAVEALREAIRLNPGDPPLPYYLGNALRDLGKLDEAEGAFRKAIELSPNYAEAYCNLGQVLRRQGRFADALAALKRGHKLGSPRPDWHYPSPQWVREAEVLLALDAKLSKVLNGEAQPAGVGERLVLAQLCQMYRKRYAAAADFYAAAFAADPRLAGDRPSGLRCNAARSAALAGCGHGMDAADLPPGERARLRRQALDWLRAELAAYRRLLGKEPDKARPEVQRQMQFWRQDTDLAGVRDKGRLAQLPAEERAAWARSWTDVADLLAQTKEPMPTDKEKPDKR
jgi:serine/threonine-protein kinase